MTGRWFDTPVAIKYVDKSCSRDGTDFPKVRQSQSNPATMKKLDHTHLYSRSFVRYDLSWEWSHNLNIPTSLSS